MALGADAKLTNLAAEILRGAVQVYDRADLLEWVGCQLVLAAGAMGIFPGSREVAGSFPAAMRGADGGAGLSLRAVFGVPGRLPGVRLPPAAALAGQARSAPLMARLEALAEWLGPDGRPVTRAGELSAADAADAAGRLGVSPAELAYPWKYALTSGWFERDDRPGAGPWAVPGQTARRWADPDDSGALHAWAVMFASVLACALDVAAAARPAARKLNLQGTGAAACVPLFLARRPGRAGLTLAEIGELVMYGAMGDPLSSRARRAWDAWVREHFDPARVLHAELAALGAVTVPDSDADVVGLTPLALWALREQFQLDGVEVPLIPADPAQMSAADLAALAEIVTEAEFETESAAWVAAHGPAAAARDLLAFAAGRGAAERLLAVNLTRGIGIDAHLAWRDAMHRPDLRGYARIALSVLASELPEITLPLVLDPSPDDVTWVATDLLALACGDDDPDPELVAAQFREAVPAGEESWIFDLMARNSHPDVGQVLSVLGRYHPDRRVRRAARAAARNRPAARPEPAPARPGGH
jgi:hypothetical protein